MSSARFRAHGRNAFRSSARPASLSRAVAITALLVFGLGLGACGQVGPLYQPPAEPQQEPTDSAAP